MRAIPNAPIVNPFNGKPYVDTSSPGDAATGAGAAGGASSPPPLTPVRAIRVFLEQAYQPPAPPPTWKDTRQALRVLRALDRQGTDREVIELEDADAEWLEGAFKERAPAIFRLNAGAVYEACFEAAK